jgi:hypothetical protein
MLFFVVCSFRRRPPNARICLESHALSVLHADLLVSFPAASLLAACDVFVAFSKEGIENSDAHVSGSDVVEPHPLQLSLLPHSFQPEGRGSSVGMHPHSWLQESDAKAQQVIGSCY